MKYRQPSKGIRAKVEDVRERIELSKWKTYAKQKVRNSNDTLPRQILDKLDQKTINQASQVAWGALIYDSRNIGDEIQTLAALNLTPQTSKLLPIHREYLDQTQFSLSNQSILPIFLNGWFTHLPDNWPPHPSLKPIFVGMHINAEKKALFDPKHKDYYNANGPIGCRDTTTLQYLESIGVEAFFSGCPTITIARPQVERTDQVLVVDAYQEADVHVPDSSRLLSALVPQQVLEKAKFVTHNVEYYKYRRHGYKFRRAIETLNLYATAKLVITSRLHCALPCMAMGTPCLFLNPSLNSDPRLIDYRSILNGYADTNEKVKINWQNPEPQDVTEFQNRIYTAVAHKLQGIFGNT
ncbi:MAG: polysaccharide pyruvyl transferase family protein [Pseudanabaenaceae cyanobacterium bins.39]|nr:polysaccharide pyruvyl transferase family protein [Pseudanabaenaceae cyanobacterium bins.39]